MSEPRPADLLARWHRERARRAVRRAIRSGRLVRPMRCQRCGKAASVDAHHRSGYEAASALDVAFLCHDCHTRAHHPEGVERQVPAYAIAARNHPGFFWLDRLMQGESLGADLTEEQQRVVDRIGDP